MTTDTLTQNLELTHHHRVIIKAEYILNQLIKSSVHNCQSVCISYEKLAPRDYTEQYFPRYHVVTRSGELQVPCLYTID